MNLALSDEQEFLREAARGTLRASRPSRRRAPRWRAATLPDLWPTARRGRLARPADRRGARRRRARRLRRDARGRGVRPRAGAACRCSGSLPATASSTRAAARGARGASPRASCARPGCRRARRATSGAGWTVEPAQRQGARRAPRRRGDGDDVTLTATVAWVPDAPGRRRCSWSSASTATGARVAVAVDAAPTASRSSRSRATTPTRSLGHVTLDGARGTRLDAGADVLARAWYLAQALIAAESLGTVQTTLEMASQYAKERFTFGRAIGSYQAIKHGLTEVLRRLENAPLAAVLRGLGRRRTPGGVPARGQRGAHGGGRARSTSRRGTRSSVARRHRRDVGARRTAVLPPRAALAPPGRRQRRRDRPRGRAPARPGARGRGGLAADVPAGPPTQARRIATRPLVRPAGAPRAEVDAPGRAPRVGCAEEEPRSRAAVAQAPSVRPRARALDGQAAQARAQGQRPRRAPRPRAPLAVQVARSDAQAQHVTAPGGRQAARRRARSACSRRGRASTGRGHRRRAVAAQDAGPVQ